MIAGPRVLLACDFLLRYTAALAGGMLDAGADVRLLTRDHGLEFGGDPEAMRQTVEQRLAGRAEPWYLTGRVRDPQSIAALAHVARERRAFAPQVVHLQEGVGNDPRLLPAAGARRRRFALTVHDPVHHPGDEPPSRQARMIEPRLRRAAALVFVHSERLRDELIGSDRPAGAVEVVPHGADEPRPRPLPEQPSLLFFGRLSAYKGLDVLLDALPRVWERFPAARVVVAGAGALPEHAALGDERVTVRAGHVPDADLPELFGQASCVVLPYRQASQSGVGSVAKTHGRPIVASAVGGLPELLADGSGLLVAPERPDELSDAIVELLADPARAAEMGATGARSAAAGANWRDVAEQTLEAYRRHGLLR